MLRTSKPRDWDTKLKRLFSWTFVVADITNPLLGFDFLNEFGLIIDCKNKNNLRPVNSYQKGINTKHDISSKRGH